MVRRWLFAGAAALLLAGCQSQGIDRTAFAAGNPPPAALGTAPWTGTERCAPQPAGSRGALAGRTLPVSRVSDIRLQRGEVVLTFDDGPVPGKTRQVLDTLDRYGVRATFMMVGVMARSYPQLVREVAARGHSIGSHTDRHPNLARMGKVAALEEIATGERAIAAALSGTGRGMAPFFRFPYLADTAALRGALAGRGTVVIDVDIDSRDYLRTSPQRVLGRTLERLQARGRGVILFHDIHARTVSMLPDFLAALKARGYTVVHLVPGRGAPCPAPAS